MRRWILVGLAAVVMVSLALVVNLSLFDARMASLPAELTRASRSMESERDALISARFAILRRRLFDQGEDTSLAVAEAGISAAERSSERAGQRRVQRTMHSGWTQEVLRITARLVGREPAGEDMPGTLGRLNEIYTLERSRRYDEAAAAYHTFLAMDGLERDLESSARLHYLFCLAMTGELEAAIGEARLLQRDFSETTAAPVAWRLLDVLQAMQIARLRADDEGDFQRARTLFFTLQHEEARGILVRIADDPAEDATRRDEAQYYLGRIAEEQGNADEALSRYRGLIAATNTADDIRRDAARRTLILGSFYVEEKQVALEASRTLAEIGDSGFVATVERYAELAAEDANASRRADPPPAIHANLGVSVIRGARPPKVSLGGGVSDGDTNSSADNDSSTSLSKREEPSALSSPLLAAYLERPSRRAAREVVLPGPPAPEAPAAVVVRLDRAEPLRVILERGTRRATGETPVVLDGRRTAAAVSPGRYRFTVDGPRVLPVRGEIEVAAGGGILGWARVREALALGRERQRRATELTSTYLSLADEVQDRVSARQRATRLSGVFYGASAGMTAGGVGTFIAAQRSYSTYQAADNIEDAVALRERTQRLDGITIGLGVGAVVNGVVGLLTGRTAEEPATVEGRLRQIQAELRDLYDTVPTVE